MAMIIFKNILKQMRNYKIDYNLNKIYFHKSGDPNFNQNLKHTIYKLNDFGLSFSPSYFLFNFKNGSCKINIIDYKIKFYLEFNIRSKIRKTIENMLIINDIKLLNRKNNE